LYAQSIADQKQTIAFIFGTIHLKDAQGHPVAIESPLGTGFLVSYPDLRGVPTYHFVYLVTAKHVSRDADGSFLKNVRVRLNLSSSAADPGFGFAELPVTNISVGIARNAILSSLGRNGIATASSASF
jgi:hypothetical protein